LMAKRSIPASYKAIRRFVRTTIVSMLLCCSVVAIAAEADYDTLIQDALQLRNIGNFTAAEEILRSARNLANETNEVDYLLGMMLAFQERFIEAAAMLDQALSIYPDDIQLLLGKARVLSYQGAYGESIEMANSVLEVLPDNSEALSLLARVYYYQRRYNESRDADLQVLELEPQNLDALIGLYDTELASGNDELAETLLDRAQQVAPDHVDVLLRREGNRLPVRRHHELSSSFGVSEIDVPFFSRWYDRTLEYRYINNGGDQFYLHGEQSHRFGADDNLTEIGAYFERGAGIPIELSLAYTGDSDFLPGKRVHIGTTLPLLNASENFGSSTLGLSYTHAEYQSGGVELIRLGLTHYFLAFNGWFTPGLIQVEDENGNNTVGWTAGLNWQANSRMRLGYAYTDAPETENNVTTDTVANHFYINYQLYDSLIVRLDASQDDRANSYTRDAYSISFQFRF